MANRLTAARNGASSLGLPYRDGTTHVVLEPLDLLARLAGLVPLPQAHLIRYHGAGGDHAGRLG